MDTLESQVAKIQIGNIKHVTSFVYILAEKAPVGSAELYMVAELPLFNAAAEANCEKICLAIESALKRVYKKAASGNAFESAIAQVNDELGKLAEMGQTHWIDKLNCILACKDGANFSIATCGKVAAYLYRGHEFTDISCSSPTTHPLKTFENVAFGKLRLDDITILSTTQLFNHLAIDRLKHILKDNNFLHAAQLIIEVLKENAGPDVAFGTLLIMQVPFGQTPSDEIDLESYVAQDLNQESIFDKALQYVKNLVGFENAAKRVPKVNLPHVSFSGSLNNVRSNTKNFSTKSKQLLSGVAAAVLAKRPKFSWTSLKNLGKWQKIFLISIVVLIVALILELSVANQVKKNKQTSTQAANQLKSVQTLLTNAQAALLYKDVNSAQDYLAQAQKQLPKSSDIGKTDQALYTQTQNQLNDLEQKLQLTVTPDIKNLGSLGAGTTLLPLGNFLATQVNNTMLSYDLSSGQISDSRLMSSQNIVAAAYIKNTTAVVYNGSQLLVWDFDKKQFNPPFSTSVPGKDAFVNIKYYSTNSRVYTINKSTNQILSFAVGSTIGKPVVASKNANSLGNAVDFAIDGNIYVLNANGVNKYTQGVLQDFHLPTLFTPFSGKGKIYTQIGWKNIYILDIGNNRILVVDKNGNLIETLKSPQFNALKDFVVDEKGKVAYVLNDGSLLKVTLP